MARCQNERTCSLFNFHRAAVGSENWHRERNCGGTRDSGCGACIGSGADIAIESADIAIESADIALMGNSLTGIVQAIYLSRATLKTIYQNLFGAFIYNALGIPIAAGILYPLTGMLLSPLIAGAAMAASSLTVVLNALRLRVSKH